MGLIAQDVKGIQFSWHLGKTPRSLMTYAMYGAGSGGRWNETRQS